METIRKKVNGYLELEILRALVEKNKHVLIIKFDCVRSENPLTIILSSPQGSFDPISIESSNLEHGLNHIADRYKLALDKLNQN